MPKDPNIIRTYHDQRNPFAQIDRRILQNKDLSWEARGVLGYLLSKPGDWEIRFWDLVNQGPGKRDRMRRILTELQTAGHVTRQHYNDPVTGQWIWVTHIYENPADAERDPLQQASSPSPAFPSTAKPSTAKPSTANPSIYIQESHTNKENTNKENTPIPSRASARDGARTDSEFNAVWQTYPPRNGKRLEKQRAYAAWSRMSKDDRELLPAAIANYTASEQIPRDMFRFLARNYWREWLTPASNANKPRQPGAPATVSADKYLSPNGKYAHLFNTERQEQTA